MALNPSSPNSDNSMQALKQYGGNIVTIILFKIWRFADTNIDYYLFKVWAAQKTKKSTIVLMAKALNPLI